MNAVPLGRSGLRVPPLILGTANFGDAGHSPWSIGADGADALVRHAFERGFFAFDTGTTYGGGLAEARLGAALEKIARREDVVISTKIFFPTGTAANDRGLSRKHIMAAIDRSLARLRTDHVDVLMIHRWDSESPIEETLTTLDQIVRSGRALYLGASSMSAWRLMKALALQRAMHLAPFILMQGHYNLLYREEEREMVPLCAEEGLAYQAWSPLARGRLAGAAANADRLANDSLAAGFDPTMDGGVLEALDRVATTIGQPPAQIALAWLLARKALPVIGAASPAELDIAMRATAVRLTEEDLAMLEGPYRPHEVMGYEPRAERSRA